MTHVVPALVHPRRSRARAAPLVLAATLALAATLLVPATGRARDAALAGDGMLPAPCAPGAHVRWVAPGLATIVPPPSFAPATASDTALACYGVPPRATRRAAPAGRPTRAAGATSSPCWASPASAGRPQL